MKHLREEDLIERLYEDRCETTIDSHLDICEHCSREFTALRSDLDEMRFADPPERDTSYGHEVWLAISGGLPTYQERKPRWYRNRLVMRIGYAAVCAMLLVSAFIGGRHWERRRPVSTARTLAPSKPLSPARPSQRVIVVVLRDHLDRSERLLVELKHADADTAAVAAPLIDEARTLLQANRICRKNMKHDDDPALRKALDHLDHLLTEVANQPEPLDSETLTRLQKELNADGLLFEVRVLRSRQAQPAAEKKGRTI